MILKFIVVFLMLTAHGKNFRHNMRSRILRMSDDKLNWKSNANLEWVWVLIFDKGSETEGVYTTVSTQSNFPPNVVAFESFDDATHFAKMLNE